MRIIEIKALKNGAHRNQTGNFSAVREGWAVIPDGMVCENFPFGEVEVAEIGGVMTVTKWIPGENPAIAEPTAKMREKAYNTEKIVEWDGKRMTVTKAAQLWNYYAAEGSEKADTLCGLIAGAKAEIRRQYADPEVET